VPPGRAESNGSRPRLDLDPIKAVHVTFSYSNLLKPRGEADLLEYRVGVTAAG